MADPVFPVAGCRWSGQYSVASRGRDVAVRGVRYDRAFVSMDGGRLRRGGDRLGTVEQTVGPVAEAQIVRIVEREIEEFV